MRNLKPYFLEEDLKCPTIKPEALPEAGDLEGQAAFWKQHYNTPLGAGTVGKYMSALSLELVG